jgi:hypothetical protein
MSIGVAALNHDSKFAAAYEKGIKKAEYWHYALEDALDLIAKLPSLAARIFTNVYKNGQALPTTSKDLDLIGMVLPPPKKLTYFLERQLQQHARAWRQRKSDRVSTIVHCFARRSRRWERVCTYIT